MSTLSIGQAIEKLAIAYKELTLLVSRNVSASAFRQSLVSIGNEFSKVSNRFDLMNSQIQLISPLAPQQMTLAERTAIVTPLSGQVVYTTDTNKMAYYNGTTWVEF
jgi:hypothetical protein